MSNDPARLTFTVTRADGSKIRWAQDESDPANQPSNFSFATVKPGGFGQFSLTLPRGLDPGPDENLLDSVTATGPGGRVVYEGRIHRLPRTQGDSKTVTVQGVGWASHLSDDRAVSALIVDRTLSAWTDPGAARQGAIAGLARDFASAAISNVFDATNGPGISVINPGPVNTPYIERWYDAGPGQLVARIKVDHQALVTYSSADANLSIVAYTASDDTASTVVGSSEQKANASIDFTAGTAHRYALLTLYYSTTGGSAPNSYGVQWQGISAHGNHGLTLTGSGYTASDILKYMLATYAPALNFDSTTIPDSAFGIPQAVYAQTSMDQVVLDVNKYELRPWYVWEHRTFYYPSRDEAPVVWQARLADGAKVAADGDDVVQMASSAYVYFTDEYGRSRVYAPTGGNGDYTSDELLGDGTDPYTTHGINGPLTFTINTPGTTADAALQIGRLWLADNNAPKRSGQIVLSGFVRHPTEGLVPSWRVRAGDSVVITDRVGDTPRPIVATGYDHSTRTNTVTLEAGPLFRLDGLVQRLAVTVGALNQ